MLNYERFDFDDNENDTGSTCTHSRGSGLCYSVSDDELSNLLGEEHLDGYFSDPDSSDNEEESLQSNPSVVSKTMIGIHSNDEDLFSDHPLGYESCDLLGRPLIEIEVDGEEIELIWNDENDDLIGLSVEVDGDDSLSGEDGLNGLDVVDDLNDLDELTGSDGEDDSNDDSGSFDMGNAGVSVEINHLLIATNGVSDGVVDMRNGGPVEEEGGALSVRNLELEFIAVQPLRRDGLDGVYWSNVLEGENGVSQLLVDQSLRRSLRQRRKPARFADEYDKYYGSKRATLGETRADLSFDHIVQSNLSSSPVVVHVGACVDLSVPLSEESSQAGESVVDSCSQSSHSSLFASPLSPVVSIGTAASSSDEVLVCLAEVSESGEFEDEICSQSSHSFLSASSLSPLVYIGSSPEVTSPSPTLRWPSFSWLPHTSSVFGLLSWLAFEFRFWMMVVNFWLVGCWLYVGCRPLHVRFPYPPAFVGVVALISIWRLCGKWVPSFWFC